VESAIVARGLEKSFRGAPAVMGVDLRVEGGERVALLGANGAGKTTTLMMLLGVITPDAGTIEMLGHLLPHERSTAMLGVGFAAGYLPLPDKLKVRELLGVYGRLYGLPDPDDAGDRALRRFGISPLATQMASELSSGQRTLVGLAKATMHHPRLLVLDEPTASLDPDVALRARAGIESLCEADGTALLVTSHNMTEVERICHRVVFLSHGKVVADGTAADVAAQFGRPSLEDVFLHLASEEL
jgi:ABC-2 type transport system ATP-binding protein